MKNITRNLTIKFVNILDQKLTLKKSHEYKNLNIFSLHSTRPEYFNDYKRILKFIDNRSKFIDPKKIDTISISKESESDFSILTFDDGFKDNYDFAKIVLNELKIKAIFFVIPQFIKEKNKFSKFYFNSLYPKNKSKINKELRNIFQHLNLEQINSLHKNGHSIGLHGFKHENYGIINQVEMKKNILKSLKLFDKLKIKTQHFAYPFGSIKDFNKESNNYLSKYFRYIYTGVRGNNNLSSLKNRDSSILRRHTISTHKKDMIYFPVKISEINFFSFNSIVRKIYNTKNNLKIF